MLRWWSICNRDDNGNDEHDCDDNDDDGYDDDDDDDDADDDEDDDDDGDDEHDNDHAHAVTVVFSCMKAKGKAFKVS